MVLNVDNYELENAKDELARYCHVFNDACVKVRFRLRRNN